jgi:hypothetical protein
MSVMFSDKRKVWKIRPLKDACNRRVQLFCTGMDIRSCAIKGSIDSGYSAENTSAENILIYIKHGKSFKTSICDAFELKLRLKTKWTVKCLCKK